MCQLYYCDTSILSFSSLCLIFNHPSIPLQLFQPLLLNLPILLILYFSIRICLSYVRYNLYQLLYQYPNIFCVYWKTIFWTYFTCIYHSNVPFLIVKSLSYVIRLFTVLLKQLSTFIWGTRSLPNPKSSTSHTLYAFYFLCTFSAFFSSLLWS